MYEIHESALATLAEEFVEAQKRADELAERLRHIAYVMDESVVFPNGVKVVYTHEHVVPDYESWAKEHVPYEVRRQYIKRVVFDYSGMFTSITGFKSLLDAAEPGDLVTTPKAASFRISVPE